MSESSQADRQADKLVTLPSYLGQVEQKTTFCSRTAKEKNKKRTEAQSISQETVILYVIDFHGILTPYCRRYRFNKSLHA